MKINQLFNPSLRKFKSSLGTLLLSVNVFGSEQKPMWLRVFIPPEGLDLHSTLMSRAGCRWDCFVLITGLVLSDVIKLIMSISLLHDYPPFSDLYRNTDNAGMYGLFNGKQQHHLQA